MIKKSIKIALTIFIGGLFLWLAFRNVRLGEIWEYAQQISLGWIIPFILVALVSHYLRAERWKLLIETSDEKLDRITLFSGVMTGYLFNLVAPRLGEITRPVYVAKREKLSSSRLIGTIVLERVIDISTMLLLMLFVAFYLVADPDLLNQIFGERTMEFLRSGMELKGILFLLIAIVVASLLAFGAWKLLELAGKHIKLVRPVVVKIRSIIRMFVDGLTSVKDVRNWGLFILLTVIIWIGYALMTYIPFWMFNMQEAYNLSFLDAITITVISAIGIAIPSPGGIGTYHYFVKQALLILFAVPAVTGLAYATVTHAVMVLVVIIFTPILLAIDKFRNMKKGKPVE